MQKNYFERRIAQCELPPVKLPLDELTIEVLSSVSFQRLHFGMGVLCKFAA